jgi:hypothetical protein
MHERVVLCQKIGKSHLQRPTRAFLMHVVTSLIPETLLAANAQECQVQSNLTHIRPSSTRKKAHTLSSWPADGTYTVGLFRHILSCMRENKGLFHSGLDHHIVDQTCMHCLSHSVKTSQGAVKMYYNY